MASSEQTTATSGYAPNIGFAPGNSSPSSAGSHHETIITATIPQFTRMSGIGRSRVYELLNDGQLDSVHIGHRRLILIASYYRLLERQRAAGKKLPRPGSKQPEAA